MTLSGVIRRRPAKIIEKSTQGEQNEIRTKTVHGHRRGGAGRNAYFAGCAESGSCHRGGAGGSSQHIGQSRAECRRECARRRTFQTQICDTLGSFPGACSGIPSDFTVPSTASDGLSVKRLVVEQIFAQRATAGAVSHPATALSFQMNENEVNGTVFPSTGRQPPGAIYLLDDGTRICRPRNIASLAVRVRRGERLSFESL